MLRYKPSVAELRRPLRELTRLNIPIATSPHQ